MGVIHEILDRTRVLPTDELVISEGFRKELMRWLENLVAPEKKEEPK